MLAHVAPAFLKPDVEALEQSAVDDAMVAHIFETIISVLDEEVRGSVTCNDPYFSRRWVIDCIEGKQRFPKRNIDETHSGLDEWDFMVDLIRDRVLIDLDWEMATYFLNANPKRGRKVKREMNIENDYFVTPAPDPTVGEIAGIIDKLDDLLAIAV